MHHDLSSSVNVKVKQPPAIYYLFLTEMWERFSYYGITAILILYMSKTFTGGNAQVYAVYGAYGALVYMTPILGGYIADKFWGSYRSVMIGGLLIALGHFVIAVEDPGFHFFYMGLAITIVGTGLFSPNINSIVGHLYQEGDDRRDAGFTLAYMGRNIGTVIAPIVCAWIAATYDWHWAFMVAGVGMLFGLCIFRRGRTLFDARSFKSVRPLVTQWSQRWLYLFLTACVLIAYQLMQHVNYVGGLLFTTIVATLGALIYLATHETAINRTRIFAAMLLTLFYIIFMVLLQQSGGALNLFTDTSVDRNLWGWHIETGMFQSVEPLALITLSPLYTKFWNVLARRQIHISDGVKFIVALVVMSSSFILLAFGMRTADHHGLISMSWINFAYVLQAAGELFIGPIGLAMVSRLIPQKMMGLYMGVWVLASSVANYSAAKIGAMITPTKAALAGSGASAIHLYTEAFWGLAILGCSAALLLALLLPVINRLARQE